MDRSLLAVLSGTFLLRFSTGLTGAMLVYFFGELPTHGGPHVSVVLVGVMAALFYLAELMLSPLFGLLSDRQGFHRVMQYGPLFGAAAVIVTGLVPHIFGAGGELSLVLTSVSLVTIGLFVIGLTRLLEGASTAASVPSILGYVALATAADEGLRGRVSARFELATIVGVGVGIAAAGPIWEFAGPLAGPNAFFLNAGFYMVSLAIFRWGVAAPERPAGPHHHPMFGVSVQRYWKLVTTSHVWLLAPTWIAVNAVLGLYGAPTLLTLTRPAAETPPQFSDQLLAGGLGPTQVTAGLVVAGLVFVAGMLYWGNRFKDMRRTTIIFYGLVGGAVMVAAALALNYSRDWEALVRIPPAIVLGGGLFVLAGATPAALGLLADMSESYPDDRGAIMGLYSVFLGIGQIAGNLIGGFVSDALAITGILLATALLLAVAVVPLFYLRRYEHHFARG
jgi:MFS family permease